MTRPSNLQGPQGPPGPVGPAGPIGPVGPPGLQGVPGVEGVQGPEGTRGDPGPPGKDGAYGKDGRDGAQGPLGPAGVGGGSGSGGVGPAGRDGKDGNDGAPGRDGRDGAPGPPGVSPDISAVLSEISALKIEVARLGALLAVVPPPVLPPSSSSSVPRELSRASRVGFASFSDCLAMDPSRYPDFDARLRSLALELGTASVQDFEQYRIWQALLVLLNKFNISVTSRMTCGAYSAEHHSATVGTGQPAVRFRGFSAFYSDLPPIESHTAIGYVTMETVEFLCLWRGIDIDSL